VGVVEQAVEHRGDGGRVAEELAPVLHGPIRSDQGGGFFVPSHHDLEEIFGGGVGQLAHPELAGFQVSTTGRFWVSTEGIDNRAIAKGLNRSRHVSWRVHDRAIAKRLNRGGRLSGRVGDVSIPEWLNDRGPLSMSRNG
jgi:hypothetical protein